MALPTTSITTTIVSQAIGLASNDVGVLCAKASVGGVSGIAFKTKSNENDIEMPSGLLLRDLIPGSKPYWNIYSAKSPGEWYKSGGGSIQGEFKYRLGNKPEYGTTDPDFSLGDFREYDHTAVPASVTDHLPIHILMGDSGNNPVTTYWNADLGSFKFELSMGALPCRLGIALYKGATLISQGTVSIDSVTAPHGSTVQVTVPIPAASPLITGDSLIAKLYLQENNLSDDMDRFFINAATATPTLIEIEDNRTPTYTISTTTFKRFNGVIIHTDTGVSPHLVVVPSGLAVGNTSFGLSITINGYSSSSSYNKYIFLNEYYYGALVSRELVRTITGASWASGINYPLSIPAPNGLKGGHSYFIDIIESTTLPRD